MGIKVHFKDVQVGPRSFKEAQVDPRRVQECPRCSMGGLRRCNIDPRRAKGNQVKSMVLHGGVRGLTVVKVVQEGLRLGSSIC